MTARVRGSVYLVIGLAFIGGCRPADPEVQSNGVDPAPKLVVRPWMSELPGPTDEEATIGVAREVTHWLQYAPGVVVREPRTEYADRNDQGARVAALLDVDHTVWLDVRLQEGEHIARWDLERTLERRSLASGEMTSGWDGFPELPPMIARVVLRELRVETHDVSSLDSGSIAASSSAYLDFIRLLGAHSEGRRDEPTLVRRVQALENLLPGLGDYPPAETLLGADYLDLAGLVGGRGPYYLKANDALARAFALDSGYPPARAELASLFAKLGRSEEAVDLLTNGLATHPNYSAFHETLGYVLRYAGLMEESVRSYRRSQELDSSLDNLVSTQDQITKSLIYLGDYDAALASHRRVMSFLEELGRSPNEKQRFYEGVIHLYRADRASAVRAFRAGARLEPGNVWTTFGRAYESMALGDTVAVESVLDELERREVVDGERHYRLVHFAMFAGHPERALDHLRKTVDGGFFNAAYIRSDPFLAPLRPLPRFERILGVADARHDEVRTKLGVDWNRTEILR